VAGFGRIIDVPAADLLLDAKASAAVADAEEHLVAALNAGGDLLPGGPTALFGLGWRVVGVDADGLDLARNDDDGLVLNRLAFPRPLRD
ncbi:hypothetical protein J8J27_28490, partial [Mycobacterium tuberculosis]|nr:hypothetical protein [Mycobacterium tuberculosis]